MKEAIKVYLVGAGPGDPEMLTVKAHRIIKNADVVVYDRLVSEEIMQLIPAGSARISVGKQPGCHPVPQDEINKLLVNMARADRCVVRLKGGDPFLFGRGGEEVAYLAENGISCEVIPGITTAAGCSASLGVPLTHRGLASGVRYVTGHCREDLPLDLDWAGLADPDTTLVIYMGRASMPEISVRLIAEGLPASTPALAVINCSRPDQRFVTSTLGEISTAVEANLKGPTLFLIGRVVELADASNIKVESNVRELLQRTI